MNKTSRERTWETGALEGGTVVADETALAVNKVDVIAIRRNAQVLLEEGAELAGNLGVDTFAESAKAEKIGLGAGLVGTAKDHSSLRNKSDSNVSNHRGWIGEVRVRTYDSGFLSSVATTLEAALRNSCLKDCSTTALVKTRSIGMVANYSLERNV